jgi:hypothetical protein
MTAENFDKIMDSKIIFLVGCGGVSMSAGGCFSNSAVIDSRCNFK